MSLTKSFIDYFAVCGLDTKYGLEQDENTDENISCKCPLKRSYKCKVLHHFPDNITENKFDADALINLCLPKGLLFEKREIKPKFHEFIITRENGSRVYGAALTFYELIDDELICGAMQTLQTMYEAEYSILKAHSYTRSTSNTQLTAKIDKKLTKYDYSIKKDKLYATKCICLLSQMPFNFSFGKILKTLYDMVKNTDLLGIKIESHLFNLLCEVPMPLDGQLLKFYVGCKALHTYRPPRDQLPLFEYDLFKFFKLLNVNNAINLYITALMEHQILLYSKDYHNLMLVAESLNALFFPFTWVKPYVPIVPASNLHFIDAPLPYIMGFHHEDVDKDFFRQGQRCFVDIDSGQISCPEDLPDFPDRHDFINEINFLINYYESKLKSCSTQFNEDQITTDDHEKENTSEKNDDIITDSSNVHIEMQDEGVESANSSTTMDSAKDNSYLVLKNSQAFNRIQELARRVGAINGEDEYVIDNRTGKVKYSLNNQSISSSSGVSVENSSSGSSLLAGSPTSPQPSPFGEEEIIKREFSHAIRELFLERFVRMFHSYEKYVMGSLNDSFKSGADDKRKYTSSNFDSKMFLIEQPSPYLPFLTHFVETQMFVSFIDAKILSQNAKSYSMDPYVKIFDERIQKFRKENDIINYDSSSLEPKKSLDLAKIDEMIRSKLSIVHVNAPQVQQVELMQIRRNSLSTNGRINNKKDSKYLFDNFDKQLLNQNIDDYNERLRQLNKMDPMHDPDVKLNSDKSKEKRPRKSLQPTHSVDNSELNSICQSLLKECKIKTKRMLVDKIPEAAHLGHADAGISGVEENMLIASLCDLIERVWGHGLQGKAGKSPLWNHLESYRKLALHLHGSNKNDPESKLTPTLIWCVMKERALMHKNSIYNNNNSGSSQMKANPRSSSIRNVENRSRDSHRLLTLPKQSSRTHLSLPKNSSPSQSPARNRLSSSTRFGNNGNGDHMHMDPQKWELIRDLSTIDKLTEVKTEIGLARAFVRLSIEKKVLGEHLKSLISDSGLLKALYKKQSFLRQEEEFEQFIYHLNSLNVVDYFCFTNHFRSLPTSYSVLIIPSKKFNASSTSANPFMKLYGSLGESDVYAIPKSTLEFVISSKFNLGPLTTMIIGHDNAGMTPKWLIDSILIRNDITGHIYKFNCGKWLGKGVEDDSLERLLIAKSVKYEDLSDLTGFNVNSDNLIQRSRSPTVRTNENKTGMSWLQKHMSIDIEMKKFALNVPSYNKALSLNEPDLESQSSAIQEKLGNAINTLVKYFEKPSNENNLTQLICGENGLISSLEMVFQFGFKSYKFFKKLFVWDYLEKVAAEIMNSNVHGYEINKVGEKYLKTIQNINNRRTNFGKDGKFQTFICVACKESMLVDWFKLLSQSNSAQQMYEEYSFLRNMELYKFCIEILTITKQFQFKLEPSLVSSL